MGAWGSLILPLRGWDLPYFPAWVSFRMPCPLVTVLIPHPCKRPWRTAEEQGCCLPGKRRLSLGPRVCWEGSWDALGRRKLRNSPKPFSAGLRKPLLSSTVPCGSNATRCV